MHRLTQLLAIVPATLTLAACTGCASHKDVRDLATGTAGTTGPADTSSTTDVADADTSPPTAETTTVAIAPAPATPGPDAPPPSLDALSPWFSPAPYAAALADWHTAPLLADLDQADALRRKAVASFTAIAESPNDPSRTAPARFMAAWIESEVALEPMARVALAMRFEELANEWPLMADVALVKAARLYEAGNSLDAALAALDRLGDPTASSSIHRAEAIELEAGLLVRRAREDEARAHLEAVAKKSPDLMTAASWHELAKLRPDVALKQAALFELVKRDAGSTLGKEAFEAIDRSALTPAMKLELARALFENYRYDAMRAVLAGFVKPGPEACQGWVLIGRSLERNKKKKDTSLVDRAFASYEKALKCKGEPRADATFLGGRNRLAKGDTKKGRKLLEAHVAEFPKRSTADDAKLLLAQDEARAKKKPATKKLLQTLRRYPTGDMADQVAWELVAPHLEKRNWAKVKDTIDEIFQLAPQGIPGRHAGRYPYWRGRALLGLGQVAEARAIFREIFLHYPLSWYAILSWSRLVSEDPSIGETLLAEASREKALQPEAEGTPLQGGEADPVDEAEGPQGDVPSADTDAATEPAPVAEATPGSSPPASETPAPDPQPRAATTNPRPGLETLWRNPHFRRAVEWARLAGGRYDEPSPLIPLIERELDAVPRAQRPDPAAWSWLKVAVLQLGGGYSRSMRIARSAQSTWALPFPAKDQAQNWRLAYPQPFADQVSRWATERNLPPAWIWGVMRVESNFEPTAVSWANAIGLMQIILPTAQTLVRDTPHTPTRENLMRPAIAVELGTKYLAKLLDRHKVYPLASAGYNAGGGAVGKWRRQFGDVEVDEFVERIPYREAHLYAKSVTQTMARYLWLYEGQMLTLDLRPVGHPDVAAPPTE